MRKEDSNDFDKATVDILAKRAGQKCSKCKKTTSGGHTLPTKATIIGEAAHISGAKPKSARFDPKLRPEDRRSANNGIWLCGNCHKEVDTDSIKFTTQILTKMKTEHEKTSLDLNLINPTRNILHQEDESVVQNTENYNNIYIATPSPQTPDTIVTGGEERGHEGIEVPLKTSIVLSPYMGIVKSSELPGTRIQLEFAISNPALDVLVIKGVYVRLERDIVHFKKFFKINEDSSREPDYTTRFPLTIRSNNAKRVAVEFENFEIAILKEGNLKGELVVLVGNQEIASAAFEFDMNTAMVTTLEDLQKLADSTNNPVVFDAMIRS